MTAAPAAPPAPAPAGGRRPPVARVLYAIDGERLEVFPPGSEPSARLTSRLPRRAHWVAEEEVIADVAGFHNIGRVTGLEVDGALHLLVSHTTEGEVTTATFRAWPDEEPARAVVAYPAAELERLTLEAAARRLRSERSWWVRVLLRPLAGALPREAQHRLGAWLGADLRGASFWNVCLLGGIALNALLILFIVGSFTVLHGVQLGNERQMLWALLLGADTAARGLYLWRASFTETTDDDEIGLLPLEAAWWGGERLVEWWRGRGEG